MVKYKMITNKLNLQYFILYKFFYNGQTDILTSFSKKQS